MATIFGGQLRSFARRTETMNQQQAHGNNSGKQYSPHPAATDAPGSPSAASTRTFSRREEPKHVQFIRVCDKAKLQVKNTIEARKRAIERVNNELMHALKTGDCDEVNRQAGWLATRLQDKKSLQNLLLRLDATLADVKKNGRIDPTACQLLKYSMVQSSAKLIKQVELLEKFLPAKIESTHFRFPVTMTEEEKKGTSEKEKINRQKELDNTSNKPKQLRQYAKRRVQLYNKSIIDDKFLNDKSVLVRDDSRYTASATSVDKTVIIKDDSTDHSINHSSYITGQHYYGTSISIVDSTGQSLYNEWSEDSMLDQNLSVEMDKDEIESLQKYPYDEKKEILNNQSIASNSKILKELDDDMVSGRDSEIYYSNAFSTKSNVINDYKGNGASISLDKEYSEEEKQHFPSVPIDW